jgi:hypothetical protein
MFYSEKNSSKLCAEGAIENLMNVLHCSENKVKQFWDIIQLPVQLILQTLGESSVPQAVLKSGGECDSIQKLGCLFLQESSGFLFFPLLWCFFHRNHNSCSTVTFSEHHQETCLYGATVESYIGYQFVQQKQSRIQFHGTLQWLLSTTIAAPPPPLLRCHRCATTTTATPIAAPPLQLPLLRSLSHCCAAIAVAAPPKLLLHRHRCCCTAIAIAALPPSLPLLRPLLRRHCCAATTETGDDDNGDDNGNND